MKRDRKGNKGKGKRESARGDKSKGIAPCIVVHCIRVHIRKECLECMDDTSYVHIIIITRMNVVDNLNPV